MPGPQPLCWMPGGAVQRIYIACKGPSGKVGTCGGQYNSIYSVNMKKRRNPVARAVRTTTFKQRVVKSRKLYSRKPKYKGRTQ
jgi:hypothetical protein